MDSATDENGKTMYKPKFNEHCTAAVDIWALAVIYYIMLAGDFPFHCE